MIVEAERLAHALALDEGTWYIVFDGSNMWRTLAQFQAGDHDTSVSTSLAERLVRAADMDLFGKEPEQTIVV